ncbi:hypothetical protein ACJJIW_19575 [Microbulbifer sp. JMSA004]|uniref:hypothetical protein n=1 Tax=unclassified Microbulbifer TaxID=2619833 RepID=UPI00403B37F2
MSMMKSFIRFFFSCWFFLLPLHAVSNQCEVVKPTIYYINGMNTSPSSANAAYLRIKELFPGYNVLLSYVSTNGLKDDVIEAAEQKEIEKLGDLLSELENNTSSTDIEYVEKLREAALDVLEKQYLRHLNGQPDLNRHLNRVVPELSSGKNVILLGYSQGSLYAKMAADSILSESPEVKPQLGSVLVGAVTNSVPLSSEGRGEYVSLVKDYVVSGVRARYPSTLPGNYDRTSNIDWKNHSFPVYFEEFSNIISAVQAGVDSVSGSFQESNCTEVISCGTPLSKEGNKGTYDFIQDLGNQPGTVSFEFEAFSIPDGLLITNEAGRTVYSSDGAVSGFHEGSFYVSENFDSVNKMNVSVDAPLDGTAWTFTMGCPNQPIENDDRPRDRKKINFTVRAKSASGLTQDCYLKADIDGELVYSSQYQGEHWSFTADVTRTGVGDTYHSLGLDFYNCSAYKNCPTCDGYEVLIPGGDPSYADWIYTDDTVYFKVY